MKKTIWILTIALITSIIVNINFWKRCETLKSQFPEHFNNGYKYGVMDCNDAVESLSISNRNKSAYWILVQKRVTKIGIELK
jgi:hypothetical protein